MYSVKVALNKQKRKNNSKIIVITSSFCFFIYFLTGSNVSYSARKTMYKITILKTTHKQTV